MIHSTSSLPRNAFQTQRKVRAAWAVLMILLATPAVADDYLMYGPSLAVWLDDAGFSEIPGLEFAADESHFATDAGHTVTIVDEAQWRSLTTLEFASFDALVIGDAGCFLDTGPRLDAVEDTRAVWSPAVTGHLFLHSFNSVFRFNNSDLVDVPVTSEQLDAMVELTVAGMEYAASAGTTGLYYAHGCRSYGGSAEGPVELMSFLVPIQGNFMSGDDVEIVDTEHPAVLNLDGESLSGWQNSFQTHFESVGPLQVLARDSEPSDAAPGDLHALVVATGVPLGDVIVFADGFESAGTDAWSDVFGAILSVTTGEPDPIR